MTDVAVLGLGSIGLRHSRNFLSLGARVVGFDPDPARRALLEEAGGTAFADRDAALAEAKAAVVATPNRFHFDDLRHVVSLGRAAMVEKPLFHTLDGADDVLRAADALGLPVFAAMNLRFHPVVRAVHGLLADGKLGTVLWARFLAASYLPDWRPHQDHRKGYAADPVSGGALFDFIHEFDMAVHLLGPAETVAAAARTTGAIGMESEDCADTILRHDGGWQTTIHVDYVTRPRQRVGEIGGTGGVVRFDLETGRIDARDAAGSVIVDETIKVDPNAMYLSEAAAFLACLADGSPPPCSGWDALAVLKIVVDARDFSGVNRT